MMLEMAGIISPIEYSKLYNAPANISTTNFSTGRKLAVMHKEPTAMYVDLDKCKKRWDFRKKIWNRSHDNYYAITEHISEWKLAYILSKHSSKSQATWMEYLYKGLFALPEPDEGHPLLYEISKPLWQFYRLSTRIRRVCEKYGEYKFKEVYRRLPNRDKYDEIYHERLKNYKGATRNGTKY